jgi:microcystin-dependent protein
MAGTEQETLTTQQIPNHTHALTASINTSNQSSPANSLLAQSTVADMYAGEAPDAQLAANAAAPTGGSQPHENTQPFLCINFIISLFGVFPSQT